MPSRRPSLVDFQGIRFNTLYRSRAVTRQQLLLDWLDIWIPATGAGLVNVNEGALGILGYSPFHVH